MSVFRNLAWKRQDQNFRMSTGPQPQPVAIKEEKEPDLSRIQVVTANQRGKQVAVEICCGHAGLTAALWDAGLEATGVDWNGNKHQPAVPIVRADLTIQEGQSLVWK